MSTVILIELWPNCSFDSNTASIKKRFQFGTSVGYGKIDSLPVSGFFEWKTDGRTEATF